MSARQEGSTDPYLLHTYVLTSGRTVNLSVSRKPLAEHHLILHLCDSDSEALSPNEQDELAAKAVQLARQLALSTFGNSGSYSLVLNGPTVARRQGLHWHILLVETAHEKGLAFMQLAKRNLAGTRSEG
jgi:hypothetical protein